MRVGLFGGTFDPIHRGHLRMAEAAEQAFGLRRIYFVPAQGPWHKQHVSAAYADRYAMVALALERRPRWLPLHIPLPPPTYSIDQVRWLQQQRLGDRVYFIVGADAFSEIHTWKNYRDLLGICDFIVLARRDSPAPPPPAARIHWLANFNSAVSSTELRRALPRGVNNGKCSKWLPASVRSYIDRSLIYRHMEN